MEKQEKKRGMGPKIGKQEKMKKTGKNGCKHEKVDEMNKIGQYTYRKLGDKQEKICKCFICFIKKMKKLKRTQVKENMGRQKGNTKQG